MGPLGTGLSRLPVYGVSLRGSLCWTRRPSSSHMSRASHRCLLLTLGVFGFQPTSSPRFWRILLCCSWDYSIRKLCRCEEAGLVACGKHSGEFLDSLVPRQTARCWQAVCGFLLENWAPQLRVCRCWRPWLALALCLATWMWVFCSRIVTVVLSLFMLLILLRRKGLTKHKQQGKHFSWQAKTPSDRSVSGSISRW